MRRHNQPIAPDLASEPKPGRQVPNRCEITAAKRAALTADGLEAWPMAAHTRDMTEIERIRARMQHAQSEALKTREPHSIARLFGILPVNIEALSTLTVMAVEGPPSTPMAHGPGAPNTPASRS